MENHDLEQLLSRYDNHVAKLELEIERFKDVIRITKPEPNTNNVTFKIIVGALGGVLLLIVGFFINRLYSDIDVIRERQGRVLIDLQAISSKLAFAEGASSSINRQLENLDKRLGVLEDDMIERRAVGGRK